MPACASTKQVLSRVLMSTCPRPLVHRPLPARFPYTTLFRSRPGLAGVRERADDGLTLRDHEAVAVAAAADLRRASHSTGAAEARVVVAQPTRIQIGRAHV